MNHHHHPNTEYFSSLLSWAEVMGATRYRLFDGATQLGGDLTTTRYSHTGLTSNSRRSYKVMVDLAGGSFSSAVVSATTLIPTTYLVGYERNSAGRDVATLWSRAEGEGSFSATVLSDSSKDAGANALVVVGSDVYIAGYEDGVAKLWSKLGSASSFTALALSDESQDAYPTALAVVGSDVYIAGYEDGVAKLWLKAGGASSFSSTVLGDGLQNASARALAVVGSDVYIAGDENNSSGKGVVKLWSKVGGASSFSPTALTGC